MLIFEVAGSNNHDAETLAAVSTLLAGRAEDETARKQMNIDAFIELARRQNINLTRENLAELVTKPPLSNILEPVEPNSNVVRFKGNKERTTDMSVDKAQDIVDKNAKAAMRRAMK